MSASASAVYEASLEELYEAGKKYIAQKEKQKQKRKEKKQKKKQQQQQTQQGHEAQLPKQQQQQHYQQHDRKRDLSEIGPEAGQPSLAKRPRPLPLIRNDIELLSRPRRVIEAENVNDPQSTDFFHIDRFKAWGSADGQENLQSALDEVVKIAKVSDQNNQNLQTAVDGLVEIAKASDRNNQNLQTAVDGLVEIVEIAKASNWNNFTRMNRGARARRMGRLIQERTRLLLAGNRPAPAPPAAEVYAEDEVVEDEVAEGEYVEDEYAEGEYVEEGDYSDN
ncbi:hypothetical protein F4810DRAFT_666337 [Camillea tinctor]|nr:hypothetical protein F4810DRAFT_666337 [Camillea tinctor]